MQPRRAILVLVLALVTASGLATAAVSTAVSDPTGTLVQQEADRPIRVPSTAYCTETIMDNHVFGNSYYQPYTGSYAPPALCPGPWNKVVLTFTGSVTGGQYDRSLDVSVGGAQLLRSSTSEPCCTGTNTVGWSVQRDVTSDQGLFLTPQPVLVRLDNIVDPTQSGYDGPYTTSATLTFYEPGPGAPVPAYPTVVLPISPLAPGSTQAAPATGPVIDPEYTLSDKSQTAGNDVTFPQNLTQLTAELFADGHGSCEEFWWSEPNDCGGGTPYREVAIYINGALAGAAPPYPTTFTGADGPGTWEPIPSPRAWNLRPYDVDLTPFVSLLTDGAPHAVRLAMLSADYTEGGDGVWPVGAVLLGHQSSSPARTTGALGAVSAPASPTQTITTDPVGATYTDAASHDLSFTGYTVDGNGARVDTVVKESLASTGSEPAETVNDTWTWDRSTATTAGGHTTVVERDADFSIQDASLAHFAFTDNETGTVAVDGVQTASGSTAENMMASGAGLAVNDVDSEDVGYSDSTGVCYHHSLAGAGGEIVMDTLDGACPGAGATGAADPVNDPDGTPYPAASSPPPGTTPPTSPGGSPSGSTSVSPSGSVSPSPSGSVPTSATGSATPKEPGVQSARPEPLYFASCPRTYRPPTSRYVHLSCGVTRPGHWLVLLERRSGSTFTTFTTARPDAHGRFRVAVPAMAAATLRLEVVGQTVYTFGVIPKPVTRTHLR